MNEIEKGVVDINKTVIRDKIEILLELAYKKLVEPKYDGYPMSDHIACFLDAEEAFGSEFKGIFNNAVPDYKDNLEGFKKEIIEPKLDTILESILQLKDSEESNFDFFSKENRVICNMALASALLSIYTYATGNRDWLNSKKEKLEECTERLLKEYVSGGAGKGWQYYVIKRSKKYVHNCSTWLSLLTLAYIPEEIITVDQRTKIKKIKKEIKDWLEKKLREEDKCYTCFRPEEPGDKEENTPNPVATAQAILALYHAGMNIDYKIIKCSIENIKDKKTSIKPFVRDEIPTKRIVQSYSGIQCCLQALLTYNTPPEDETVQYLSEKTIEFVNGISSKHDESDAEKYSYYPTLTSLLLYLFPPAKPVLIGSMAFQNIFKSFVSEANSIILVGEIDTTYANLIPNGKDVMVLYRDRQDPAILEEHYWMERSFRIDDKFNSVNYVIVDESRGLFSSNPFCVTTMHNYTVPLEEKEMSSLVNQLEIPTRPAQNSTIIKQEILDKLSEFPKHREIIEPELETMETEGLQGILEYVSLNPKYAEGAELASALGLEGRESVERELSEKGVFSRIFVNSKLKNLMEHSMSDDNDNPLVLDESSAYLILNCGDNKEKILKKCLAGLEEFYVTSDIYDKIEAHLGTAQHMILKKIEDKDNKYIDAFESLQEAVPNYHFNENEKIEIGFIITEGVGEIGIITNSWEVTKTCKENNIRTFSLMKFLDKDADTYKLFRIPVDKIAG